MLDLPGGGIEFGEEDEKALTREVIEETGLVIKTASLRQAASRLVRYIAEDGIDENLHHVCLIYDVSVGDGASGPDPKPGSDGQDSGGAAWILIRTLSEGLLSPFAGPALFGRISAAEAERGAIQTWR